MNLLIKTKLEELLLKNWASFMDTKQLMALVLKYARDTYLPESQLKVNTTGIHIKLSRFEPNETGFIIWAEFNIPREDGIAKGTTELHLSNLGIATHIQTLGNLFQKNVI